MTGYRARENYYVADVGKVGWSFGPAPSFVTDFFAIFHASLTTASGSREVSFLQVVSYIDPRVFCLRAKRHPRGGVRAAMTAISFSLSHHTGRFLSTNYFVEIFVHVKAYRDYDVAREARPVGSARRRRRGSLAKCERVGEPPPRSRKRKLRVSRHVRVAAPTLGRPSRRRPKARNNQVERNVETMRLRAATRARFIAH